jgi:hypothetical protein
MEIILVSEPYPRDNRRDLNINTSDPLETARSIFAADPSLSEGELNEIYKRFGGLDAFRAKSLSEPMKRLRYTLMRDKNFSSQTFIEIFDGTVKIGRGDADSYAVKPYFLTDLNRFMRVWNANRTEALGFFTSYNMFGNAPAYYQFWEHLPLIHSEHCRDEPGKPSDHYFCEKPKLFLADRYRDAHLKMKKEIEAIIDPKVVAFIQENILECLPVQRELYARSLFVRSDHWEKLAKDPKRSVLNEVAGNVLLPTSVAKEIVLSHKTPALREAIARKSVDKNLLYMIWSGTKSETIREAVEENALFY